MSMSLVWLGLVIYIVIAVFVAYLSRSGKQTTMESYFLGDRKLSGFVSALVIVPQHIVLLCLSDLPA